MVKELYRHPSHMVIVTRIAIRTNIERQSERHETASQKQGAYRDSAMAVAQSTRYQRKQHRVMSAHGQSSTHSVRTVRVLAQRIADTPP